MADGGPGRPSWMRFSGIGINFVAGTGVFAFLGYWIVDSRWGTWPWGLLGGLALGLVGSTYNLIRETKGAFGADYRSRKTPPEQK